MSTRIEFTLHADGRSVKREIRIGELIIAGWTGRDPVARDRHIAELEALGIKRPASTPVFYRVAARRLCVETYLEASGEDSSGEVEFVLLQVDGRLWVGVGSDHTDRKVEAYNVTVSKQMCDKPLAPELWAFDEIAAHWDSLILRSFATIAGERQLYQEGRLDAMLAPADLIGRGFDAPALPDGAAMFGGTLAAKGGIRSASRFDFEIEDPLLWRRIRHGYAIQPLPIRG